MSLSAGGQVAGRVTDRSNGAALGGVEVDIYDSHQSFITSTCTASDGSYTLNGLASGTYYVGFNNGCGASNYLPQYDAGQASLDSATPVSVTAGQTTAINGAMQPGGQVTGTVTAKGSGAGLATSRWTSMSPHRRSSPRPARGRGGAYTVNGFRQAALDRFNAGSGPAIIC